MQPHVQPSVEPSPGPSGREPVTWNLVFLAIWGGHIVSLFGSQIVQFALLWWLTRETGSASVLAMTMTFHLLPNILLSPLAGTLVDRWNRRIVMIASDCIIALVTVGLIYLFATDSVDVFHIYGSMLIRSAADVFYRPAMHASIPLMVPKEHLARIAGFNQMIGGIVGITTPPLGALLLERLPMPRLLAIDVITAAIAVLTLLMLRFPQPKPRIPSGQETRKPSVLQAMIEGGRYVWRWPGLRYMLIMAAVVNALFHPALALLPLLTAEHLGGAARELGWIQASWGIGVAAGGLTLGLWGGFRRKLATSMLGLIGMGAAALLVGLSPAEALILVLPAMFVIGFMNPIVNGPARAMLQLTVAPDMQGRVFTLVTSAIAAASPLSLMLAGAVADSLGVAVWYAVTGVICLLLGAIGFFIPTLMNMGVEESPADTP